MSRPQAKRRRRFTQPSEELEERFSSHIFESASTSQSSNRHLRPCSFEITLNHDTHLKRSLQPQHACLSPHHPNAHATRLVTWTSSSGEQTILTDRYDAVHLLSELPLQPQEQTKHTTHDRAYACVDELAWSDLDSDTEDLFYMSDLEASTFKHDKASARLEAQHTLRLATLKSPTPDRIALEIAAETTKHTHANEELSPSQFVLLQKTARVLATSTNASMLELKIIANHANDPRFSFLRQDKLTNPTWHMVWQALKTTKGEMSYEQALQLNSPSAEQSQPAALVAYDDSDTDSDNPTRQPEPVAQTTTHEAQPMLKTQKQPERLARAKQWLKTHSKPPPAAPS